MKPFLSIVSRHLVPLVANWKTTIAGIAAISHGVGTIANQLTTMADGTVEIDMENLQLAIGEIIVGFGLIFARDANKSSQDSGVR